MGLSDPSLTRLRQDGNLILHIIIHYCSVSFAHVVIIVAVTSVCLACTDCCLSSGFAIKSSKTTACTIFGHFSILLLSFFCCCNGGSCNTAATTRLLQCCCCCFYGSCSNLLLLLQRLITLRPLMMNVVFHRSSPLLFA